MPDEDEIGTSVPILEPPKGLLEAIRAIVDRLGAAATALVSGLGLPRDAEALWGLERAVHGLFAKASDEVTAAVIDGAQRTPEGMAGAARIAREVEQARGQPLRAQGVRPVEIRLLGGSRIRILTRYEAPVHSARPGRRRRARGASGAGCYPALDHFGLVERTTPALASEVARQSAALASFREAERGLAARGIDLDVKTVRRLSEFCGERALRCRDALVEAFERGERWSGGECVGKRIAVVFDGGRTRTRLSGKRGRRRRKTGRRGFKTPWREPKVLAIYEFDEKGRKTARDPIYEGTFESWDDAFRIFTAQCARRGVGEARELVFAADGSDNIWDHVEDFVRDLGIDPERVTKVVDYYHASEYVSELAGLCANWSAKRRRQWNARASMPAVSSSARCTFQEYSPSSKLGE